MVALFLRPDADISDGGWTDEGGATTLFDAVDESSFSDTDYIKSSAAVGDKVSLRLSDPTGTPTEPMTIRVRCKREGTDATDLIGRLYEATSPPTLICYFEIPTLTTSFADYMHELPAAEFAAIGDFNNLYIEFESNSATSHHGSQIDLNFQTADYYNSTTPTVAGDVTDYLSCSRASIGYAKTAAGTLTQFASNTLRITTAGLLVEDSRTNDQTYSQSIAAGIAAGSPWTGSEASAIDNSTTAPDGTTTATKFTESSASSVHQAYYSRSTGAMTIRR